MNANPRTTTPITAQSGQRRKQTMRPFITSLAAVAVVGLVAAAAHASPILAVNFTPDRGHSEAGFNNFVLGDKVGTPQTQTISGIDVSVQTSNQFRSVDRDSKGGHTDYVNGGYDLPELTAGWFGNDGDSTTLTVTLDGADLGAGSFEWTSWHVDQNDQTGLMDIAVSTNGGTSFATKATDFDIVDPDEYAGRAPNPFSFTFTSNGTDDVLVRFTNHSTASENDFNVVNGFQLIPEPATFALLGLGGAVMLSGRKRRRA